MWFLPYSAGRRFFRIDRIRNVLQPILETDLLDITILHDLYELDGSGDFLQELLGDHAEISEENIAALEEALREGRSDAIRELAHALKGACLNVGAMRQAAVCHQLEFAPDDATRHTLLELLKQVFTATRATLQAQSF